VAFAHGTCRVGGLRRPWQIDSVVGGERDLHPPVGRPRLYARAFHRRLRLALAVFDHRERRTQRRSHPLSHRRCTTFGQVQVVLPDSLRMCPGTQTLPPGRSNKRTRE